MLAVRSWNLVIFLSTIGIITFVCIGLLASWLIWEMGKAKAVLDEIRKKHTIESASEGKKGENYFNEEINKSEEKSCYLWPWKVAGSHSSEAQESRTPESKYEDTFKKAVEPTHALSA